MDLKIVTDYTRLSMDEVQQLDCYTFRCLVRDAFIHNMSKSEEGRDYLEQAYMLQQTAPDRAKLRHKIGVSK